MNTLKRFLCAILCLAPATSWAQISNDDLIAQTQWINAESIELAIADMVAKHGVDASVFEDELSELKELLDSGFKGLEDGDTQAITDATLALELYRSIMMKNPLIKDAQIYVSRFNLGENSRKAMTPALGTQKNNWSNQQSNDYFGYDADIVKLSELDDQVTAQTIYKTKEEAVIADLHLHWSGEKLSFTSVMPDGRLNMFEVATSGEEDATPLINTSEPDLEFYDGIYLPDGRLLAISNIGYQAVPCVHGDDPVGNTVLYDPETKSLRRLTFDQDANWNPVVRDDGVVMYTRWEYTDLTHYFSRMVMTMNPDGTMQKAIYGSGEIFPNSTFDLQPIPGSPSAFVATISGHHGVARSGRIVIIDPAKGNGAQGMVQELPFRNREIIPLVKDRLVDGVWPQFIKPMPINDSYFLVIAKLTKTSLWGIYLVDVFDNLVCIYQNEGEGFMSPILDKKSEPKPVILDRVDLEDKEATVFIQDIYEGKGLRGVPKGVVKTLRLHAYDYAYNKSSSNHEVLGIQSGWDIKRELGVVPVEEDGSAIFKVPANTPISIQPMDENGRAVQWMRSWFTAMPGEIVSCVGCHEDQNTIAIPKRVIASQAAPHAITTPEGGVRPFTFDLEVQPVLDRACVECHNENNKIDLRAGRYTDRGFKSEDTPQSVTFFYRHGVPSYSESYLALQPYVRRQGPEADMAVLQPYEYHASTSDLIRMLEVGHHDVTLTPWEWSRLTQWIDYNAPEKGVYPMVNEYKGVEQCQRRTELYNKYAGGAGVDWKQELEDYAKYLSTRATEVPPTKEKAKSKKAKEIKVHEFPFSPKSDEVKRRSVELSEGVVINFVWIPEGKFVMGHNKGLADHQPAHKASVDKGFWMAETEITNEQYAVLTPEHDSRYVDQMWKDHTTNGIPANEPQQPVIRVSYNDIQEFCKKFEDKTGVSVTIPTETQWEWACRAGSDKPFWFGELDSDYGEYENLADSTIWVLARMKSDSPYFETYNYLPKDAAVIDNATIQTDSKSYAANPYGLYSMHGNVAEWSRSPYTDYATGKNIGEEEKYVVRGGSYFDRAKYSTAYSRRAYYPWQRLFNVGFRLIIEE
ncbi:MAG: SUMF1/EgtB/PvdO family nonheme iron enzyme [Rikenellaceae bacterium]